MPYPWPDTFQRIPDEDWTRQPLGELALKYDTVETHGWYSNLELTISQLDEALEPGAVLVDYSGGTGILLQRLLARLGGRPVGAVIVDASPKFLRLALEKLGDEPRTAFRLMRYRKDEGRLELLDEILSPEEMGGRADVLASTNAVHLYYDLSATLAAWTRTLRPGGLAFVQSGNIRNVDANPGEWIIDETVDAIHDAAVDLVQGDSRWSRFRAAARDAELMDQHARLRRKFFLPVRDLSHYVDALTAAGFDVVDVASRTIEARVDEWYEFLSAYHEGVLGWAGGSRRVEGTDPEPDAVGARLELLREAMDGVFAGDATFPCCWTYITARVRPS